MDSVPLSESPDHPSQRLVASVEALQSTNSRILDRLRPNDIDALGLSKSIEALIDRMRRDAPHLVIAAKIDPAIDALDPIVSQTIYRVVQESLTNVLRHSGAAKAWVDIACSDGSISIGIADDGVGLPHDLKAGRGLIGMRERSRAIGASFEITNRPSGGASLRWSMLAGEASDATQKTSRNSSSLSNSATSKG
jgi:two-component system sensor histidine kinase UhpB